jgi:hypothetical protein
MTVLGIKSGEVKKEEDINKPSKESLQISSTKEESAPRRGAVVQPTLTASETFKEGEKKTKRQKRDKERYGKKQHTKAEVRFRELLNQKHIPCNAQVPFTRTGETTREGLPKVYIADFVLNNLIFELEGPGTSSDSIERDLFFKKNNCHVVHIPNELAIKHGNVLIELIDILYHKLNKGVPNG